MYELEKQIVNYVHYLNNTLNLCVTIHGGIKSLYRNDVISQCNIHNNPYCQYIKTSDEAWQKCIKNQEKVYEKLKDGAFFGLCCMGVGEYVYPIYRETEIVGFISVSGYKIEGDAALKRIRCVSKKYRLDTKIILELYESFLKSNTVDKNELDTIIIPLAYMMSHYVMLLSDEEHAVNTNSIFANAVSYIKKNYWSKITIEDLAKMCHCSNGYIIKLFKKNTGKTAGQYIQDYKIEKAKNFLKSTQVSIGAISCMCGFSDSNYFSAVFKKHTQLSPSEYREKNMIISEQL